MCCIMEDALSCILLLPVADTAVFLSSRCVTTCRVPIVIPKVKAKTGSTRRRIRCARRATPMFLLTANTQAENEKTTGEACAACPYC